jgi:hypothetical protein
MLGISATAMADPGHRWNNDHGKNYDRYEHRDDRRVRSPVRNIITAMAILGRNTLTTFKSNIVTIMLTHHVDTTGLKPLINTY